MIQFIDNATMKGNEMKPFDKLKKIVAHYDDHPKTDTLLWADGLKLNVGEMRKLLEERAALVSALETLLGEWNSTCDLHGWDRNHLAGHDMAVAALKLANGE